MSRPLNTRVGQHELTEPGALAPMPGGMLNVEQARRYAIARSYKDRDALAIEIRRLRRSLRKSQADQVEMFGRVIQAAQESLMPLWEETLRNIPSVNVRLPSHHSSPFRAHPIDQFPQQVIGTSSTVTVTTVTIPTRHLGIIERIGWDINPVVVQPLVTISLRVNGVPVEEYGTITGSVSGMQLGLVAAPVRLATPIHLRGGDVYTVVVTNADGANTINPFTMRSVGYFYLQRADVDGIRGTIVD